MSESALDAAAMAALPRFDVAIEPPDLSHWRAGNTGVPGFVTRAGPEPGPHVGLVALMHGNELAGAVVLAQLLAAGLRPARGRLTMGFANLAAFDQFDAAQPTASRFVDEDMNRLWDVAVLEGPRQSSELARAREMRPLIDRFDVLLDLHSMLWASEPLVLSGTTDKGRALAHGIGTPPLVVADSGHVSGRRLIEYDGFADPDARPVAALVEAGQHWEPATVETTMHAVSGLLRHLGMIDADPALPSPPVRQASRFARVTVAVTASTAGFAFLRPFRGGEVVAERDTLIAVDGDTEIRTPHDDCLLVMPSLRPSRGHTAVRLARFED